MVNLKLTTQDEFMAVLEALTQFTDNTSELEDTDDMTPEMQARLDAARGLQTQLEAVLIKVGA